MNRVCIYIQGRPHGLLEPKSAIALRHSTNSRKVHCLNELILHIAILDTISLKWNKVFQMHFLWIVKTQMRPPKCLGVK